MSLVRLLPAWLHAVADYAVAITLIVLGLAVSGTNKAMLTGVVVGAVVLLVSLLTRYPLGVIKVLPFTVHSAGDYLAATLLVAAPFALNFTHTDKALTICYVAAGIAVLGVSLITNYQYGPKAAVAKTTQKADTKAERGDARQWYTAAAGQRTMPVATPEYASPEYAEVSSVDSYRRTTSSAAAGGSISLRDAIAASRQREAS